MRKSLGQWHNYLIALEGYQGSWWQTKELIWDLAGISVIFLKQNRATKLTKGMRIKSKI